jgi:transcriptional antiterminator Rof (Rho-off)
MRIRKLKKGDRRSRKKKQTIHRKQRKKDEKLKVNKEEENVEKR